jgi:hypothetical protein
LSFILSYKSSIFYPILINQVTLIKSYCICPAFTHHQYHPTLPYPTPDRLIHWATCLCNMATVGFRQLVQPSKPALALEQLTFEALDAQTPFTVSQDEPVAVSACQSEIIKADIPQWVNATIYAQRKQDIDAQQVQSIWNQLCSHCKTPSFYRCTCESNTLRQTPACRAPSHTTPLRGRTSTHCKPPPRSSERITLNPPHSHLLLPRQHHLHLLCLPRLLFPKASPPPAVAALASPSPTSGCRQIRAMM